MARPKAKGIRRNSDKFCSQMFKQLKKCESGKIKKRKDSKTCIQSAIRRVTKNLRARGKVNCKNKKRKFKR